jgi:CheY-like chemotaxis protein
VPFAPPDPQPSTLVALTRTVEPGSRTAVVPASILAMTLDPEVRDVLMELALAEGFGVKCAANEAEAAALLRAERPGLMLIDLDLAAPAGARFLRAFRQSPYRDIPCVVVTASNDRMLTVSVDAPVFFKPALDALEATLERLLRSG